MKSQYLQIFVLLSVILLILSSCSTTKQTASSIETEEQPAQKTEEETSIPQKIPPLPEEKEIIAPQPQTKAKDLEFDNPPVTFDPFNDPNGPFYHQVFVAHSDDGLNFEKKEGVVFDKASVPDIVKLPNGRIIVYAVDGARRSKSGLMVAISDDNGEAWQQGSLQLKSPRQFASGADPEAVFLPDGRIRLYYVVFPAPQQPGIIDTQSKNRVHSALSSDGIHFEEEEGFRFEYPQITDPDIAKIGDKWLMYLAQGPRLIAALSSDGLIFKYEKIIREQGSVSNTINVGENLWRQFFCAFGEIRSATTSDGVNWNNDGGNRLKPDSNTIICDPAPVQVDSKWLLFYKVGHLPRL
ncbi:exo-alpha-sialidase [Candidatus Woesearchaeota archaeon]|nr:exo-alpha-sialidase [Candidatus Woesearchaeota archaeon]